VKLALLLAAALLAPLAPSARAKAPAKRKKTAAAKPKKKAPESRYKSTALSQSLEEHYLFDEDGNPVEKKKPSAATKTKAPSDDDGGEQGCSSGLSCSDADSL